MYHRGKEVFELKEVPFIIKCTNCGSHDVNVIAFEHWDLEIRCRRCGSYLEAGTYNETVYSYASDNYKHK